MGTVPEIVASICASMALVGGVFLWVVKMIVAKQITDSINGFKTREALLEQKLQTLTEAYGKLEVYVNKGMHDRLQNFAEAQLESFRAGLMIGEAKNKTRGD